MSIHPALSIVTTPNKDTPVTMSSREIAELTGKEHQHRISVHGGEDFINFQPVLLRHGADRLFTLYRQAKLPMKANWDGQFTHEKLMSLAS